MGGLGIEHPNRQVFLLDVFFLAVWVGTISTTD
jgi:hypothetical protein